MTTKSENTARLIERPAINPDRVYLTDEAAVVLGVQPSTIRAFVRRGKLKGRGRPYRFLGQNLLAVL